MASPDVDPRAPQKRMATTPSGRQVWVDVTGDDRLKVIARLPSRWPEVIKARERGETLEQIARWAKVPPPCQPSCRFTDTPVSMESVNGLTVISDRKHAGPECLAWFVSECYSWVETELQDLAASRARLMV